MRFLTYLLLLLPALSHAQASYVPSPDGDTLQIADTYDWTLVKNKDGIKIYMRSIEGTNRKQFKGVMEIAAPIASVADLVNTSSRNFEWINTFTESENLTPESGNTYYERTVLSMPFFANDRDLFLKITFRQTETSFLRAFTAIADYKPVDPKYVRMDLFDGYWAGQAVDKRRTKITHIVSTSPGGNLNENFANNFVAGASYKTMSQLRELMESQNMADRGGRKRKR